MNKEQVGFEIARLEATIRTIDADIARSEKRIEELKVYRDFNDLFLSKLRTLPGGLGLISLNEEETEKIVKVATRLSEK